jgi:transcriptional regulator with XRE-family HTH domain
MNANEDLNLSAERLKELRESRGLSQEQLAKIIGVDRTTIVKYETGASRPTRYLKRIAHYFNVTTDYLLGNEEITPKKGYYLDNETAEIANALKEGDGMLRVMFDTVRKLPPEKMREAANYIEYLKAKQHPEEE